ncbi:SRPBCC family protein [Janibacter melonis]|uniref:SRPBCC family protein n=1 Tax=Janibacter melonis TaxID=262209 RepID=UPI001E493EE3|nr:SRPBCC family protein [Janibacter melonis]MCB5992521.1 SRPBCC family protein [Janibacter melonis]
MISRLAFTDAWEMEHPADEVLRVLADVDSYMRWWPQIKEIERVDAEHGQLRVCSSIPISLRMTITREAELPEIGLLRVRVQGDLRGWSQWHVAAVPGGCRVAYTQEVSIAHPFFKLVAAVPVLGVRVIRANHDAMMRGGARGLGEYLAA